jgi:hypothetical protein
MAPLDPTLADRAPMTAPWFPAELPSAVWLRDVRSPAALLDAPPGPEDAEGLVRLDLCLEHGRIAAVAPAGCAPDGPSLDGGQVWPGLIDAHVHLDKTMIWPRAPSASRSCTSSRPGACRPPTPRTTAAIRSYAYGDYDLVQVYREAELRAGRSRWIGYYNARRPHSALAGRTPDEACAATAMEKLAA